MHSTLGVRAVTLLIRGREPSTVFGLHGSDENSASFGLGWALEHCRTFRARLVKAIFDLPLDSDDSVIRLQQHAEDGGYTDLEIQAGRHFHIIAEAKRGWEMADEKQFKKYLPRLLRGSAVHKRLISVSGADGRYALRRLPRTLEGVPVSHLSWAELKRLAGQASHDADSLTEKFWLSELERHLEGFVLMGRETDNRVYVVSLGQRPMVAGQTLTSIDVVEIDKVYFHPVGNNWPTEPPNYIGFRYRGTLQSVHHVESFEVVENLAERNPLWPATVVEHFVYQLGPPMRPPREVDTGNIYQNGRVWCAIDTLISGAFPTISEARAETKRRLDACGGQ